MKGTQPTIPPPAVLGRRIRRLRAKKKLSQAAVARAAGMHPADLCNIEKGRGPAELGSKRIVGLAAALGVSPTTLLEA